MVCKNDDKEVVSDATEGNIFST